MTAAGEPLLDVRGLTVRYDRGRGRAPFTALRDVDLTVAEGETLSVVGESGSGKTTLGNAVLGLVRPAAGTIRFAGEDIAHLRRLRMPVRLAHPAGRDGERVHGNVLQRRPELRAGELGRAVTEIDRRGFALDVEAMRIALVGGRRNDGLAFAADEVGALGGSR